MTLSSRMTPELPAELRIELLASRACVRLEERELEAGSLS